MLFFLNTGSIFLNLTFGKNLTWPFCSKFNSLQNCQDKNPWLFCPSYFIQIEKPPYRNVGLRCRALYVLYSLGLLDIFRPKSLFLLPKKRRHHSFFFYEIGIIIHGNIPRMKSEIIIKNKFSCDNAFFLKYWIYFP